MTTILFVFAISLVVGVGAEQKGKPPTVDELLAGLRSGNSLLKSATARAVATQPALRSDPRVRQVVLEELNKSTELVKRRRVDSSVTLPVEPNDEYANVHLGLLEAAASFEGLDVLEALLPEVGLGTQPQQRLAKFGPAAIERLVDRYESPEGTTRAEAMRFGVQKVLATIALQNSLSAKQLQQLRDVAARSLRSEAASEVAGGMYLGAALRDPGLVAQIRALEASKFRSVKASPPDLNWLGIVVGKAFAQAGVR
jgi:hypothetical protein